MNKESLMMIRTEKRAKGTISPLLVKILIPGNSSLANKENSLENSSNINSFGFSGRKVKPSSTQYIESESSYVKVQLSESKDLSKEFDQNDSSRYKSNNMAIQAKSKSDLKISLDKARARVESSRKMDTGLPQNKLKDQLNYVILNTFGSTLDHVKDRPDLYFFVAKYAGQLQENHLIQFFESLYEEHSRLW